jgi:toxin secretion/phage lysis holin
MKNIIQVASTLIGGFFGWYLGGVDGFIYALVAFVLIDYLSGVMLAITERKISSHVGFRGIFRKVLIFALVGIGNVIDVYLIKNGSPVRTACIFFYLGNEGISILENVAKMGLPVPEKLKNILEQINEEDNENE